jgi:hypothetical protein
LTFVCKAETLQYPKKQEMGVMQNYDLGRVFSRLFQMVAKCFLPASGFIIIGYVVLTTILFFAFGAAIASLMATLGTGQMSTEETTFAVIAALGSIGAVSIVIGVLALLFVSSFLMAGVIDACLRSERGETPTLASCFSAGSSKFLKVTGYYVLWYIISLVLNYVSGFIFGLVLPPAPLAFVNLFVGLFYYAVFAPAIPAIVNEDEVGVLSAFSRAWGLVSGHYWMVFLTLLLWVLIYLVVLVVIVIIMALLGGLLAVINKFALVLLIVPGLAILVAISIFTYGTMATIYNELKLIKEGGDGHNMADVFS